MNSATATAAGTVAAQARTQWPNAFIVVMGPAGNGNGTAIYSTTETQIFAAAAPYVNGTLSQWQGVNRPWTSGTGTAAAPAGNGNNDLYVGSDGVHLNDAGIAYIATRMAPVLRALWSA